MTVKFYIIGIISNTIHLASEKNLLDYLCEADAIPTESKAIPTVTEAIAARLAEYGRNTPADMIMSRDAFYGMCALPDDAVIDIGFFAMMSLDRAKVKTDEATIGSTPYTPSSRMMREDTLR